jgi:hypothetical protein
VSESRGPTSGTSTNNHFFWRGLAAAAAGVISGDNKLFAQGVRTYATAIGETDDQGAFPDEMARHELAMHYQAFAIEPLVMIAELAYRQGLNIYSVEQRGHRLSDAVNFLSRALAYPSIIRKYTPEAQQIDPDFQPGSALLSWTELWTARTGDPAWQKYMSKPFFDSRLAGSTTLFAAPPIAPGAEANPASPREMIAIDSRWIKEGLIVIEGGAKEYSTRAKPGQKPQLSEWRVAGAPNEEAGS